MITTTVRLIAVCAAVVWLNTMAPGSTLLAQSGTCTCEWQWEGLRFPLAQPVCGSGSDGYSFAAIDTFGCYNGCNFYAREDARVKGCSTVCVAGDSYPATSFQWWGTWRLSTGGAGSYSGWDYCQ